MIDAFIHTGESGATAAAVATPAFVRVDGTLGALLRLADRGLRLIRP